MSFETQRSAHRSVSNFDTVCNSLSLPLVNIIRFSLLYIVIRLSFKTRLLESGFHTVISNVSYSSPINVGPHNFPLF